MTLLAAASALNWLIVVGSAAYLLLAAASVIGWTPTAGRSFRVERVCVLKAMRNRVESGIDDLRMTAGQA